LSAAVVDGTQTAVDNETAPVTAKRIDLARNEQFREKDASSETKCPAAAS
jgi:hypothetical protein